MFYKYFSKVRYAEDGKNLYRELCKKYHPDNPTGDAEILKAVNVEFEKWWSEHKHHHKPAEGANCDNSSTASGSDRKEYKDFTDESIKFFMNIIQNLVTIPDIEIEIVGTWIWLSGNTYPVKDIIKSLGFRWSKGKSRWYWTNEPFEKRHYKHKSMDAIRATYGSTYINKLDKQYSLGAD